VSAALAAATAPIAAVVAGIAERGHAVARDVLPAAIVAGLRERVSALDAAGAMTQARVGRGAARSEHPAVRGDRITWLAERPQGAAEIAAFALFEQLRTACNRELTLGLFEFEGHYALYPPGASYARHRDRFRDDDARLLSCVLYLNAGWRPDDGGALRLHFDDGGALDVAPEGGTLVAFLAEAFEHEVLPGTRPRVALAGWFRRRALGFPQGGLPGPLR
jgi:SM-20-related protein